jgi:hypothetical protein
VIEVVLWTKTVELNIISGRAPDAWADKLWQRMASAPFKQDWKMRPQHYIKPYKRKSEIKTSDFLNMAPSDAASQIVSWIEEQMQKAEFKEAVSELEQLLAQMPTR